jgi:hypothetical protein
MEEQHRMSPDTQNRGPHDHGRERLPQPEVQAEQTKVDRTEREAAVRHLRAAEDPADGAQEDEEQWRIVVDRGPERSGGPRRIGVGRDQVRDPLVVPEMLGEQGEGVRRGDRRQH